MMKVHQSSLVALAAAAVIACALPVQAKDKKKKTASDSNDAIEVVAHLPANGAPVTRFLSTPHYSGYYLYVEHQGGGNMTLIDVSQASKPQVLAEIPAPAGSSALYAVAGSAALFTDGDAANSPPSAPMAPQTVRIMDLSDPAHPKIAREFSGVTALMRDDRRSLIYLANSEGVWILYQKFATDPKVEEEYARHVIYDH